MLIINEQGDGVAKWMTIAHMLDKQQRLLFTFRTVFVFINFMLVGGGGGGGNDCERSLML